MTRYQEACYIARGAALGQLYCRDAREPEMTGRELMACYRRHKAQTLRLMEIRSQITLIDEILTRI